MCFFFLSKDKVNIRVYIEYILFLTCHAITIPLAQLAISLCRPVYAHWSSARSPPGVDSIIDEVGHFYPRLIWSDLETAAEAVVRV